MFNKQNVAKAYRAHKESLQGELYAKVQKIKNLREELEDKLSDVRRELVAKTNRGAKNRRYLLERGEVSRNLLERSPRVKELRKLIDEAIQEGEELARRMADVGKAANSKNALAKQIEQKANSLSASKERSANAAANYLRNSSNDEEAASKKAEKKIDAGLEKLNEVKKRLDQKARNTAEIEATFIAFGTVILDALSSFITGIAEFFANFP